MNVSAEARTTEAATMTRQVELSAGTIDYVDTRGDGAPIVLLPGHDGRVALGRRHRRPRARSPLHRPDVALRAHRHPMHADADLSPRGIAALVEELLQRLDLNEVTLVGNDTGGALVQLIAGRGAPRVGRIVLVSCDAFDNFPPGLTGRTLMLTGKLPPALFGLFLQQMRLRPLRRLPLAFGWLTKRGDVATAHWMIQALARPDIRRDTVRVLRAIAVEPRLLLQAAERLGDFNRPALVVWASEDRVMPPDHGRRLAELLPQGQLVEIPDSYTLIPLDQPARLAQTVRDFVSGRI